MKTRTCFGVNNTKYRVSNTSRLEEKKIYLCFDCFWFWKKGSVQKREKMIVGSVWFATILLQLTESSLIPVCYDLTNTVRIGWFVCGHHLTSYRTSRLHPRTVVHRYARYLRHRYQDQGYRHCQCLEDCNLAGKDSLTNIALDRLEDHYR